VPLRKGRSVCSIILQGTKAGQKKKLDRGIHESCKAGHKRCLGVLSRIFFRRGNMVKIGTGGGKRKTLKGKPWCRLFKGGRAGDAFRAGKVVTYCMRKQPEKGKAHVVDQGLGGGRRGYGGRGGRGFSSCMVKACLLSKRNAAQGGGQTRRPSLKTRREGKNVFLTRSSIIYPCSLGRE